ncbi:T9SS type A sorting domain-containing protein [candidate division KSB1 bacterium]|nr:T9SS type A sorting domain-containing protein [candidate division KSB1 bacterium]
MQILINNKLAGVTDQLGAFSVAVPQAGTYTLKPVLDGHTFNPAQQSISVTNFVEGIEFLDPTTSTLSGLVSGGCETFLGVGTIRLQSLDANGCFDKLYVTDGSGSYSIVVPAQAYTISLDAINNPDESMILNFFRKDTLDLTSSDETKDFEYHAPPEIKITGPYAVGCGDFTGIPVMRQLRTDTLDIEIFERYNYNGKETICFVDSGDVLLRDAIADGQVDQNFTFKNGMFRYAVTPGVPNILADDPAHPYQKLLSLQVTTPFYTENDSLWAVVTGHKPRPGEPFSTVTPQVPIMVLHDPPGDQSYSYLEKESTQFINVGMSFGVGGSLTQFSTAKVGGGFDIPFVGSGGAYAKVSRSLEIGASLNSNVDVGMEISATERFNTSDDQEVTGNDGDVFIGGAINMKYGITDVLNFDDCGVDLSQAIVWGGDGFATRYIYTENYVRTSLLPELQYLADHAGTSDKAARFLDAIEVWNQVLALNEQNKSTAPITKPNISFSGNLGTEESETITQSLTGAIEFNVYIENNVAVSAGVTVGDFNEAEAGVKARIRFDFGASLQVGTRQRNTIGYYLGDDDAGDDFSVNIRGDGTYGTPVFELIAGTSSNPWEGLPSQPRDGVAMSITPPIQDNIPPTQAAIYELRLFNTSPSNETREYLLDLVQSSNPGGARLRIGDQFVDKLRYTIPAGSFQQATLDVSRLAGHPFDYEDLMLRFYAENDPQFADTVSFTTRFVKPCSEITLAFPQPGWRINQVSGETVPVALADFDGSSGSLQNLRLEYSEDETDWTLIDTFSGDALLTDTLIYAWDVSQIPNGAYLLRAVAVCNSGENYSLISDGYIDRSAWSVHLRITDGGGIGTGERLTFGQSSVAGPGLDGGIGEAELPPPPPSGVFYAGFQLPATNAGASLSDFRHSDELNLVWDITLQPGVGGFPMLLSWNPALLPAGDFYLQDNITGDIVNVDMKQQASFLLQNAAVSSLKIDFVSSFQCQTLNVEAGWNILSVPLTANDMFTNNVFPEATSKAFTFAEGYRADDLLHSGTGYWLKFPANDTLELCGREANSNEMALKKGWNLVGPFAEDVAVADVQTTPSGIISSQFFGYSNGYAVAEQLQAGKGYWVRVAQDGLMRFSAPTNAPALTKSGGHNAQIANIDGNWGTISITDNARRSATLYAADRDIDTETFALPPAPPAGIFDVRFSDGTFVAPLQEQEHDIFLNAAQFPVTISANGLDLQLTDAVTGELLNAQLKDGESLVLKNAALTRLRVTEIAIPDQYVLHQNYPNPFNPQTTIAFDLPQAGAVNVVIYNTLGQEVARISDGRLDAGTHTFTFDARNLASGVYFLRMHAGPFQAVKKMLLLR